MFGDGVPINLPALVTAALVPHLPITEAENREAGVVLAQFHRVWPLAGLALALVVTVCSIAILGYVAIKLL